MELLKVSYKNFFSSGKNPIVIDFTKNNKTLILGKNGDGKSTILDSICFGLYGKTYKEVNKPTIVNSINKKNCVVEIEFKQKDISYKVVRGIKPNIFEIYKEDVLVTQSSGVKEYQDYLEKEIIQVNFNTFKQIAIIGKSGFTPFMKLSPANRRIIIEDILDLSVFTNMAFLVKEKLQELKESFSVIEINLSKEKNNLRSSQSNYNFITSKQKEKIDNDQKIILEKNSEIEAQQKRISDIDTKISEIEIKLANEEKIRKLNINISSEILSLDNTQKKERSVLSFYSENDDCPTCKQTIDLKFKGNLISLSEERISEIDVERRKKTESLQKVKEAIEKLDKIVDLKSKALSAKNLSLSIISRIQKEILDLQNSNKDYSTEIDSIYNEMVKIESSIAEIELEREKILKERDIYSFLNGTLKDEGIKATVISTFIPLINKYINKYLDLMNFYVQFEIDENFNEVIRSRYRDEFSYDNFSEGEKSRIDLALLFAWRAVAKERSSTDLKFIFLDEVHSGSLDIEGETDLMSILESFTDTKIVVITHSTFLMENNNFDRTLVFSKDKNFSTYKEI